ncbi:MAG TPA: hypothetical protein DD379_20950 [Cyanobacteria bacterium UBA11162]|nr:hypothetical protein [Cyanobacteria bacterium UBA11162]
METKDRYALLKELTESSPSSGTWLALRELFLNWPNGEKKDQALTETAQKLHGWDDNLRELTSTWRPMFSGNEANPFCSLVRTLEFHRHSQGATSILKKVAESPRFTNLTQLRIINSEIEGYGFQSLAKSLYLKNLIKLTLHKIVITERQMEILCSSPNMATLKSLKLSKSDLTGKDTALLTSSPYLRNLEELDLSDNLLQVKDIVPIIEVLAPLNLRLLNLKGNPIKGQDELRSICPSTLKLEI